MHRFDESDRIPFIKRMHEQGLIASISVGVKDYEYNFVSQLKEDAPEYITIDIAHGHSDSVIDMIQHIKKELPDTFPSKYQDNACFSLVTSAWKSIKIIGVLFLASSTASVIFAKGSSNVFIKTRPCKLITATSLSLHFT